MHPAKAALRLSSPIPKKLPSNMIRIRPYLREMTPALGKLNGHFQNHLMLQQLFVIELSQVDFHELF